MPDPEELLERVLYPAFNENDAIVGVDVDMLSSISVTLAVTDADGVVWQVVATMTNRGN